MSLKSVVTNIILLACFIAFIWYTGIKGMVGFVIGAGVTAYLMMTDNSILQVAVTQVTHYINKGQKPKNRIKNAWIHIDDIGKDIKENKKE
jgi:hypothetical protein